MTLTQAKMGTEYFIKNIDVNDEELENFLFTLGCYADEKIVVVLKISGNYVVSIRDGRYNIDKNLANAISLYE